MKPKPEDRASTSCRSRAATSSAARLSTAPRAIGRRPIIVDDQLRSYGINQPPTLRTNWDTSFSLGGPIKRDRLWFFANVRGWANASVIDGIVANRFAGDATRWDYSADSSIEARTAEARKIVAARLTAQVTPRNRVTFSHDYQRRCGGSTLRQDGDGCRQAGADWIASGRTFGADTVSPETFPGYHNFPYNTTQATYSAPISSRTLIEAGYSRFTYGYARFGQAAPDGLMDIIPVTETSSQWGRPQFSYRAVFDPLDFGYNDNDALNSSWRAAVSYVTGAHNMKVGYSGTFIEVHNGRVPNHTQMRYTFNANAPESAACPAGDTAAPVSDRRVLLPLAALGSTRPHADHRAVRAGSVDDGPSDAAGRYPLRPGMELGTGGGERDDRDLALQPAADFVRATVSVAATTTSRRDSASPTTCSATARRRSSSTAASISKPRPATSSTARTILRRASSRASDPDRPRREAGPTATATIVVDCNLLSPALQDNLAGGGDLCAAVGGAGLNFGNANPNTTTINPDILGGWGVRPHDWQIGASVQHELVPRLSIEAGYNRRWWGNFFVTDNTLTTAADYDTYSLVIPQHENLPGGRRERVVRGDHAGGECPRCAELHDEREGLRRRATAYWHGVDFTATARMTFGLNLQGGTRTGRGVRDTCNVTRCASRAPGNGTGRFVRRHRELGDVVPRPRVIHVPED